MSFSSCFTSANICKGCRDAVGGVKSVYVVAGCVTGYTENANQEILTVGATGGTVYQFQVEKNTSNFVLSIWALKPLKPYFSKLIRTVNNFETTKPLRSLRISKPLNH